MLLQGRQLPKLRNYIDKKHDKDLLKWWAHFKESRGEFEEAMEYFKRSGDDGSMVRLLHH